MKNTKQKQKNLYEMLLGLKDHRRPQGRRHELGFVLMIATMSIMSGYHSLRAMDDFVKKNENDLIKIFNPKKNRLPSFNTIARSLRNINYDKLAKIFHNWSINYVDIKSGEWVSADGKAMGGTISDQGSNQQNFISLVSMFASKKRQVIQAGIINSKKESEIPKMKELIKMLDLENVVLTMDALHC